MKKPSQSQLVVWTILITAVVFGAAIIFGLQKTKNDLDEVRRARTVLIYTHSSFMDPFGPGDAIKKLFEEKCDCVVQYIDAGGVQQVVEKIVAEPDRRVDVLLGLDLLSLNYVANSIRLQGLKTPDVDWVSEIKDKQFSRFRPYDWSPMGVLYKKNHVKTVTSFKEFLQSSPAKSLSVQDPEMSSPGLMWLYWLYTLSENKPEILAEKLKSVERVTHSVSPSWSTSYGIFKSGQTNSTFSFLTSLIYHWQEEKNEDYDFMIFEEGHPLHIEFAAIPESCLNCSSAQEFVNFLVTQEVQEILLNKNFMLPAVVLKNKPEVLKRLPNPKIMDMRNLDLFVENKKKLIDSFHKSRK